MNKHLYKCPVRWSDMDVYGVVNNVSIMRLLEEARVDFIWGISKKNGDAFFDQGSVVVSHSVRYHAPLVHKHEPVNITMWVSDISAATVTIAYTVHDGDRLCTSAETTMAPYCYKKSRPRSLSAAESAFFETYLHQDSGVTS
ncbi:thioesterase [Pseudoalteromonas sp. GCY]|uniref:acyl-CoA thioesterase n=1 Tax=Pseudoalteromonas sp. GCY TaxID=2003316 RepID=UPI000BFED200|nr:thioesterase family protein [Pseudoalteromonas sp. GCY]PHI35895.1 thioesterase [Pseudoalteromonas sp. GCY]QQQ68628.1 acyl-CoA thioesterase [Pseudoalteromonas sp. GCY]